MKLATLLAGGDGRGAVNGEDVRTAWGNLTESEGAA